MTDKSSTNLTPSQNEATAVRDSPNKILYNKMEHLIDKMQDDKTGVPIKTVKSLLTKIPDVFSGEDLVLWLINNLEITDQDEAIHLGSLIASHGYFFPIDDHVITLKNDGSFYRFQRQFYWPSKGWDPENTEYAVYLCKRTMQNKARLELADYEAENLARLQRSFSKNWEVIFARAEKEAKGDRKRDKIQRKVFDSQERAFWDVHRPVPGCVNTCEVDIKKAYWYKDRTKKSVYNSSPRKSTEKVTVNAPTEAETRDAIQVLIKSLQRQLDRHCLKMSKVCESLISYTEQQKGYDPQMTPVEPSNPWVTNEDTYWTESRAKDITPRRATRWKFSFGELLKDEQGRQQFRKFLQKEYSAENLDFYLACKDLKMQPVKKAKELIRKIYKDFLSDDSPHPINIDSKIMEITDKNMEVPDRYCFEQAQEHIYHLMKNDSYARFLKSDHYKGFITAVKKGSSKPYGQSRAHPGYNPLQNDSSSES
ncbi:regulator of G-protein signaling 7-like [Clavelina lepadiformis]|uniref:regulator of G-protein signaling 7-like n=1 Tax=Clavelina lepadiformis TaxID=159417 RepID=UPI0040417B32